MTTKKLTEAIEFLLNHKKKGRLRDCHGGKELPLPFDILSEMLKLQQEFQETFGFYPPLKDIASAVMHEGGELWGASEGKWWSTKKETREHQVEEIVDIIHFVLQYSLQIGVSAQELYETYLRKLYENYERQERKGGYKG